MNIRPRKRAILGWTLIVLGPMACVPYIYLWSIDSFIPWENRYDKYMHAVFIIGMLIGLGGIFVLPKSSGAPHLLGCGFLFLAAIGLAVLSFLWCPGLCVP